MAKYYGKEKVRQELADSLDRNTEAQTLRNLCAGNDGPGRSAPFARLLERRGIVGSETYWMGCGRRVNRGENPVGLLCVNYGRSVRYGVYSRDQTREK